jgi:hypothetical protein
MPNRVMLRLFLSGLMGLILAALIIVASKCALAPSSEMKSLLWLPRSLAYWADLQPTFRNFPAFGLIGFFATMFAHCVFRSLSLVCVLSVAALVSGFSIILEGMQLMIPTRCFEWADIGWSVAGVCAGLLGGIFVVRILAIFFSRNEFLSEKTTIAGVRGASGVCRRNRHC